MAMIILGAITSLVGEFDRRISLKKLTYSAFTAVSLQLYVIATIPLIIKSTEIIPLLYAIPIIVIIIFLLLLFDKKIKMVSLISIKKNR